MTRVSLLTLSTKFILISESRPTIDLITSFLTSSFVFISSSMSPTLVSRSLS